MNYKLQLAKIDNDKQIRKLLADNPMPGSIQVSFEREPNFFNSLPIQGKKNQVIIAKKDEKVVAVGTRSIQEVFINKKRSNVGYLSNLRIDKKHREKGILTKGMTFLKHLDKGVDFYYSTIVDKNNIAKRIFLANKPDYPKFYNFGDLTTYVIPTSKRKVTNKIKIKKATNKDIKSLIHFVNNNGKNKNLFPYLSNVDFKRFFKPEDFIIAYNNNKITGIICIWNQLKIRQTVVKGYNITMQIIKPFYNLYCNIIGKYGLPKINKPFKYLYLSYIAVKDDDVDVFKDMLNYISNHTHSSASYLKFALHQRDKLNKALSDFKPIEYKSTLYICAWKNIDKIVEKLKGKVPFIEIARV